MTARGARFGAILACLAAAALGAAPARAESTFALDFLGEKFDVGDGRVCALGGFMQMADDSLAVLEYNPAMVAWCKRVTFGASAYLTRDAIQGEDLKHAVNATKFSSFAFAFPVFRKRVSFAVGYRGRYDTDGEFRVENVTPEGAAYADVFERTGGLWAVPFTLAADLGRFAKLGAFYSLERGRIENRWTIDFASQANQDAGSRQEFTLSGNGFGAGASVRPIPRVSLGVAYEGKIDYDVTVEERHTNSSANVQSTESASLPERWTVSAGWRAGRRLHLFGGASVSDFTRFSGLDFPSSRLAREETYALGVEYHMGRTPLRASVRYQQLPFTLPDGENVTGVAFTIGSGLVFRGGRGKMDAALQFGKTGAVDTNGYADRSVRLFVSITGSEDWKTKREDRY